MSVQYDLQNHFHLMNWIRNSVFEVVHHAAKTSYSGEEHNVAYSQLSLAHWHWYLHINVHMSQQSILPWKSVVVKGFRRIFRLHVFELMLSFIDVAMF